MHPKAHVESILRWTEFQQRGSVASGRQRFVHYTSADVAVSIIRNKSVWMRNASVMNDFSEIEHGQSCFDAAWSLVYGEPLRVALNRAHPGIVLDFQNWVSSFQNELRTQTYITCLSEHDDSEDSCGRLSMWRAYGGKNGVALVLNPEPFLAETDELAAYSHKVLYQGALQTGDQLLKIGMQMMQAIDHLQAVERDWLLTKLIYFYRATVLCIKHPGFAEEREWRIIHLPFAQPSKHLLTDLQVVRGTFQKIFKIPLADDPSKGLFGASIDQLLNRIIIGPCEYPSTTRDAFVALLEDAHVSKASSRVVMSELPLRNT